MKKGIAKEIICIVPTFYPDLGGVGDYALRLAEKLREKNSIQTHFMVARSSRKSRYCHDGFPVDILDAVSFGKLADRLPVGNQTVILHYEPYGYEKRGCPRELVKALRFWKSKTDEARLITMFHGLYAFGPPWTSSFWLSYLQQRIVQSLANLSNYCLTSNCAMAKALSRFTGRPLDQIVVLPIFSTVGEPHQLTPLTKRFPRLILFGLRGIRERLYSKKNNILYHMCKKLEVDEVVDIGQPVDTKCFKMKGIPIISKGVIGAPEISRLLAESLAGFACYSSPSSMATSSVFAAFCAHQMLPVVSFYGTFCDRRERDGLRAGRHYWIADDFNRTLDFAHAQPIAENAHRWYQMHNRIAHAEAFFKVL